MTDHDFLPIRVMQRRKDDIRSVTRGGGPKKCFCEVNMEVRNTLVRQVNTLGADFSPSLRKYPNLAGVAKVKLKKEAYAKSHRPTTFFSETCPVIGVRDFGELLISVTTMGLEKLQNAILSVSSQTGMAALSTIESITAFSASEELGIEGVERLEGEIVHGIPALKVKLFHHSDDRLNTQIEEAFLDLLDSLKLPVPKRLDYGPNLVIYRVEGLRQDSVTPLTGFIGTQCVGSFPSYHSVKTASRALRGLTADDFPVPGDNSHYPTVGIVDSGTRSDNSFLTPWIVAREEYVPEEIQDNSHGSFVAGLLANPHVLNNRDPRFPDIHSRILDVIAVPDSNENFTEDELITILEDALKLHRDVRVWNLSIGTDGAPCKYHEFSDLAMRLDSLQDEYGVIFVFAGGNYATPPFRSWPPEASLGDEDRIRPPADSARGLTVGALAHLDSANTRVRKEQPSPFSRKGPGAGFLPKPEISHYGGNCDAKGYFTQTGVLSVNATSQLAEDIGTSFAAPLVAGTLANVDHQLGGNASRTLLKALLIHSAVLRSEDLSRDELPYKGFGIPGDVAEILGCTQDRMTMAFELELRRGKSFRFERDAFPIPNCLRGKKGGLRGELVMTLVYDPPLDPVFGAEYCRTNVDVALGVYEPHKKENGKFVFKGQIPLEPKDYAELYEAHLIQHGFKWSPVKVYRRRMADVQAGKQWGLRVEAFDRSDVSIAEPQNATLLVTIRDTETDPTKRGQVYNETLAEMNRIAWASIELPVRTRVRAQ